MTVSTFASGFNGPGGLACAAAGNLSVANLGNGTVSKVSAGVASIFASRFSNHPDSLAFAKRPATSTSAAVGWGASSCLQPSSDLYRGSGNLSCYNDSES